MSDATRYLPRSAVSMLSFGSSLKSLMLLSMLLWAAGTAPAMARSPELELPVREKAEPQPAAEPVVDPAVEPATQAAPTADPTADPTIPAPPQPLPSPVPAPTRTVVPAPAPAAPLEDTYVLGPGDQIQVTIFNVPELSGADGQYTLLIDGSITAQWIGRQVLQGLTIEQAAQRLTTAYAPFIRDPLVTINLLTARTLRVSVAGEVNRPGSYIISPEGDTNEVVVNTEGAAGGGASQWPTISQALNTAGGITQLADLRRVQVRRPQPDGSEQVIDINLWELLRSGQLSQDLSLRDRDTILVPTATALSSEEALLIGSASFAPELINVNVVGEVNDPGAVELPPNTSLNQALLAAGGFESTRAARKTVDLVRLNPNGTATRRTIEVDLATGLNEDTNPSLRNNDTIIVRRSGITAAGDAVENFLRPFGSVLDFLDIFSIFD